MAEYVADVSEFQDIIDWDAYYNAGFRGAILRATVGTLRKDRMFDRNWAECGRLGIKRVAYAFNYPAYNAPQDEADYLNSVTGPLAPGEGLMADFEDDPGARGWPGDGRPFAAAFLSAAGPADYAPFWYASPSFVTAHNLAPLYPTWKYAVAHYGVNQPTQVVPANLWQFTSQASVAGISGNCDLNVVLRGSFADLLYGSSQGDDMYDQSDRDKLNRLYQILTATDAAKDDAGNPIDDHWAAGYTLSHVRAIEERLKTGGIDVGVLAKEIVDQIPKNLAAAIADEFANRLKA